MFDLSGKKVLITGASGGIGRELSKSFLEMGAKIIVSGTDSNRLNSLKEDLHQKINNINGNGTVFFFL